MIRGAVLGGRPAAVRVAGGVITELASDLSPRGRERSIDLDGWWDTQMSLALLGALVQFGWDKALGGDAELEWWLDRARRARPLLDL